MIPERCPVCGTDGRVWNRKPEVFQCPNCSSIFSPFGMVLETEKEDLEDFWN
jgi:ribosomal protein L37AE/L43A